MSGLSTKAVETQMLLIMAILSIFPQSICHIAALTFRVEQQVPNKEVVDAP
jgi:hypothetical protein